MSGFYSLSVAGLSLNSREIVYRPAIPTKVKMIRLKTEIVPLNKFPPKIMVTRSYFAIPTRSQFKAPIITSTSASRSIGVLFIYTSPLLFITVLFPKTLLSFRRMCRAGNAGFIGLFFKKHTVRVHRQGVGGSVFQRAPAVFLMFAVQGAGDGRHGGSSLIDMVALQYNYSAVLSKLLFQKFNKKCI